MALTIFGGRGFVLGEYVRQYHDPAIGHVKNINARLDYNVYSEDVLYGISTVTNMLEDANVHINTNLTVLMKALNNWKYYQDKSGNKGCFNFLSSWSVYGSGHSLPVSETAHCNPSGYYIASKYCAEKFLEAYCVMHGFNYRILRLCNILGSDPKISKHKNGLQYNMNLLAQGKDVELFGDGNFQRDFMHVRDAARAIDYVISKGGINEVFNIGNGKTWSYKLILEFSKVMLKSSGNIIYKAPTEFQKKMPVDSFYYDISKLRALGFVPEYTGSKLYSSLLPKE